MERHVNEHGKMHYTGVDSATEFDADLFHKVDLKLTTEDKSWALHTNIGSLTVVDRMTGFGYGIRDIETGFRDKEGNFWLASGGVDVRYSGCKTIVEAIEWIKRNANNCIPELK